MEAEAGEAPLITEVVGNGAAGQILDGVVITGEYLARAAFELRGDGPALPLERRFQQDQRVEVTLPADIRSGMYTLVATNQAGADQATIELLLPEVTGQQVLDKLNNDPVTGQLDPALIPATSGGGGNYLVNGDLSLGLEGWTTLSGTSGSLELVATTGGISGDYAIANPTGAAVYGVSETIIPANRNRTYQVDADFRQTVMSNNGTALLAVRALDESGNDLTSGGVFWLESTPLSISDANWHHVSLLFGAGTDHELPPATRHLGVAFVLNDNGGVAGDRVYHVQGLGLFSVASAGGIPDGSITPEKLSEPYAGAASPGGPASDLSCSGCVSSGEVAFNYAASSSQGGAATDVACTNCVSASEVQFNYAGLLRGCSHGDCVVSVWRVSS